jgi:putative flavoprotein involved in K+ transport
LAERGIDHVVLERVYTPTHGGPNAGLLRLLTPNWQSRLPGYDYEGNDPDGYRTMPEVVAFIDHYAKIIAAPIELQTRVTSVRQADTGYVVETTRGSWQCRAVVLASGACNLPAIPVVAEAVPREISTVTSMGYHNPAQLPDGGVLVVGASATGTQLADEIHRSGRPVTMAVGEHIRAPECTAAAILEWWMDAAGILDERYDTVDDINRARRVPSLQLAGSDAAHPRSQWAKRHRRAHSRPTGRHTWQQGAVLWLAAEPVRWSDLKMNRLLNTIDEWVVNNGLDRA